MTQIKYKAVRESEHYFI